jgi:hypothetical protein
MDSFGPLKPIVSRIGNIAAKTAYHHAVGMAGHGVRKIESGITEYHGPDENSVNEGIRGGGGGGGGGFLGKVGNVVGKVGGILGGIENGLGSALRIGKAVAPLLPAAAALLV